MNAVCSKNTRAFSMIELVIVLAIIGIVSVIALPKFAHADSGRRLSAAKNTLIADIDYAKLRARTTGKIHVIKFYPTIEKYIIVEGTTISRNAVILSRDFTLDPYKIDLSRVNLPGDKTSVITVYGQVSPGFDVGLTDDGVEVMTSFDGIASVGITITSVITAPEVGALDVQP
jgi:prepilin-type N-terminal cleavage/methylation domain-containing protein